MSVNDRRSSLSSQRSIVVGDLLSTLLITILLLLTSAPCTRSQQGIITQCFNHIFRATSPGGAAAKYCDDHVCVSVCLSVCQHISGATRAIFTDFLCMLPIAVARSSSFRVTKPQGEWTVWGFAPY